MSVAAVDPQFAQFIAVNLAYWRVRTIDLTDETIAELDADRGNVFKAVQFGLHHPDSAENAVELVISLFALIERRGYWSEWVETIRIALDKTSHRQKQADLLNQLGVLHRALHQMDLALQAHRRVLALSDCGISADTVSKAHTHMASVHYLQHQYDAARRHCSLALKVQPDGRDLELAAVYNTMGLIEVDCGAYNTAVDYYTIAIERYRAANELTYLAMALDNLGIAYNRDDQSLLALNCFDEAIAIFDKTASELQKSMVLLNKGLTLYQLGELREAEKMVRLAYSPFLRRSSSLRHKAYVTANLGCIILDRQQPDEALYYLGLAAAYWEEMGDMLMLGNTLGDIGSAYAMKEDTAQARIQFDRAVELITPFTENVWAQGELAKLRQRRAQLDER